MVDRPRIFNPEITRNDVRQTSLPRSLEVGDSTSGRLETGAVSATPVPLPVRERRPVDCIQLATDPGDKTNNNNARSEEPVLATADFRTNPEGSDPAVQQVQDRIERPDRVERSDTPGVDRPVIATAEKPFPLRPCERQLVELMQPSKQIVEELRPKLWDIVDLTAATADPHERGVIIDVAKIADWNLFGEPGDNLPDRLVVTNLKGDSSRHTIQWQGDSTELMVCAPWAAERLTEMGLGDIEAAVIAEKIGHIEDLRQALLQCVRECDGYALLRSFDIPEPITPGRSPLTAQQEMILRAQFTQAAIIAMTGSNYVDLRIAGNVREKVLAQVAKDMARAELEGTIRPVNDGETQAPLKRAREFFTTLIERRIDNLGAENDGPKRVVVPPQGSGYIEYPFEYGSDGLKTIGRYYLRSETEKLARELVTGTESGLGQHVSEATLRFFLEELFQLNLDIHQASDIGSLKYNELLDRVAEGVTRDLLAGYLRYMQDVYKNMTLTER